MGDCFQVPIEISHKEFNSYNFFLDLLLKILSKQISLTKLKDIVRLAVKDNCIFNVQNKPRGNKSENLLEGTQNYNPIKLFIIHR